MVNLKHAAVSWRSQAATFVASLRANPTLAAVSAEGFLTRLGFGMVGFALPLYALALGMDIAEVGLLYVLRTISTMLVKPGMGWAADRFGYKSTLVVAVALRCLVGLLLAFASQPWHLYAIRILHGAMTAARDPSASALIAEHGDKQRMASSFAWYLTARDVGKTLGYAAAGLLIQFTGQYQLIFLIAFLTSCTALVTVIRYVREGGEAAVEAAPVDQVPAPSVPFSWADYRGLMGYAVFGLMVAGSAEMMRGLFPVIATQYAHLTAGQAGLVVGVAGLAILIAGPMFGWLSDHVSRKVALGVRSMANTISSLLYIALPSFGGYFVARVMDETGKAAFRPTWGAMLAEASEANPRRRAQTMTFIDSAHTLGEVLGPLAAGLLISGFGVPVMLGVRAVLALVTEIQAIRLSSKANLTAPAWVGQGLALITMRWSAFHGWGRHGLESIRANYQITLKWLRAQFARLRRWRNFWSRRGRAALHVFFNGVAPSPALRTITDGAGAAGLRSPHASLERGLQRAIKQRLRAAETTMLGKPVPERWASPALQGAYREAAIFQLIWKAGLRASEVVALRVVDVDLQSRRRSVIHVRDGGEAREVAVVGEAAFVVNEWLKVRPRTGTALFLSAAGRRMTMPAVQRVVEQVGREAAMLVKVRSAHEHDLVEALRRLTPDVLRDLGAPQTARPGAQEAGAAPYHAGNYQ